MEACRFAKIGDDFFDFAEWDEVTKFFLARIEPDALAAIFRDIGSKKFFGLESRGEKVDVIDKRVCDVCSGKGGRELRLPNALGEPRAGRKTAEVFFEIGGKSRDLFALIFGRDGDENRFVKSAAHEFHMAGAYQFFQTNEILGAMLFDPGEKRTGIVKAEMNAGMFFEFFDEREIGSVVGFLEDMLEIAAGLMGVNEQSQMEILRHGDSFFLSIHDNKPCKLVNSNAHHGRARQAAEVDEKSGTPKRAA